MKKNKKKVTKFSLEITKKILKLFSPEKYLRLTINIKPNNVKPTGHHSRYLTLR